MDYIGLVLFEIADHALIAKESIDSDLVKDMWIAAVLRNSGETSRMLHPPVDCTGNNMYSVFQHLYAHCSFEIISQCLCGTLYHYDYALIVYSLLQVTYLGDPQKLHLADMPRCLTCNTQRILRWLIPIHSVWMIVFSYRGSGADQSPLLADIPHFVHFRNIRFKLEYLTFSHDTRVPNVYHEVSLQFIRRQWYVYDSTYSPRFRWWAGDRYTHRNARLQTIAYFRL
jgi:hypothetical protein